MFRFYHAFVYLAVASSSDEGTCSATGGCASDDSSGTEKYFWPHAFGHPRHYGTSPYKFGGVTCDLEAKFSWKWHYPAGRYHSLFTGKPIIDGEKNIYLAIYQGIRKFTASGTLLWGWDVASLGKDPKSVYVMDTPAIMSGVLYDCATDGTVFALDMETGALRWNVTVTDLGIPGDQGFVTARDGRVFLDCEPQSANDGQINKVVALNGTNGDTLWEFRPEVAGVWNFLPLFPGGGADGTMVFQSWEGAAHRVNLSTGEKLWRSGPTNGKYFTDGGAALGPNQVIYTVSHEAHDYQIGDVPAHPGGLRAFRVSDGKLLWEKLDLEQGIFAYPVVGRPAEGGPLTVLVGVGKLMGLPGMVNLFGFFAGAAVHPGTAKLFAMLLLACAACGLACGKKGRPWRSHCCRSCGLAVPLTIVGLFIVFCKDYAPQTYTFSVQAFDAETGEFFWRADLPPYRWYAAKGDESGFVTRLSLGMRPMSLPSAASYPILDAQGIMYFGYSDGHLYKIKDWNGDGVIDNGTEICRFDMGTTSFTGGPAIAPGMLAFTTSDGLFVFSE